MKRSPQIASTDSGKLSHIGARGFLELFGAASSQTLIRAAVAVAIAWLPLATLSAFRGGATFRSFLTDYATQSRFLIVIPILILAELPLRERINSVAKHFESFLVPHEELSAFQRDWTSGEKMYASRLAKIFILLLTYATVAWLSRYLSPQGVEFMGWWKGGGGFRVFSPAGTWAILVSYPILIYLTLLWLWRRLLWARFLQCTTRLNLRLIAAHPDRLGGLGFLEGALRGQLPFSFCLGVGLAGAVANRVFNDEQKLMAFRHMPLLLIGVVLLICVAPYFVFITTLMRIRRRGMLRYGALARAMGEQFEEKWLHRADTLDDDVLNAPDFSATTDLYSVVGNINDIRVIPVGAVDLYALIGVALTPAIPVVIASIPFDTVIRDAMKLMF